jgi:spermidine/putrescine-binding protein
MRLRNQHQLALVTLGIIFSLFFSACGSGNNPTDAPVDNTQPPSTGPLNVLEWSGYELPEFWSKFAEAHPDVKVDYSFFAEDSEGTERI